MNNKQPILITGAERSGSTLVAKILDLCGVWSGHCNNMFENNIICQMNNDVLQKYTLPIPNIEQLQIPVNWKQNVENVRKLQQNENQQWMVKHSGIAKLWPIWNYAYPDAKWIIVRRRTGDVVQSCIKTGYMKYFKNEENLRIFGFDKESDGWLYWVHQYEKRFVQMIEAGLNCRIVWPERMVHGNYEQVFETVEWLGLRWNPNIPSMIDPLLTKSREIMYENNG